MNEEPDYGAIIRRRDVPQETPWTAGDLVETFVLGEPVPWAVDSPEPLSEDSLRKCAWRYPGDDFKSLRVEAALFCPHCGRDRMVDIRVDAAGALWGCVNRDSIPAAFIREADNRGRAIRPLHEEPNGHPHVELVECRKCHGRAVVALGTKVRGIYKVAKVFYGAMIRDE